MFEGSVSLLAIRKGKAKIFTGIVVEKTRVRINICYGSRVIVEAEVTKEGRESLSRI